MIADSSRPPQHFTWFDRFLRRAVAARLAQLKNGHLIIRDALGTIACGDPDSDQATRLTVLSPRFYRRLVAGGGLGAAESLMDGDWTCDDLTTLVRIFVRNIDLSDSTNRSLAFLTHCAARLGHRRRKNTRQRARQNIHEHYDLGNDFFRLFLDETLNYSCGIFARHGATMGEASHAKMDQVCRRLKLKPHDHLVEIGTGWGGLALHAARYFGCRVTTTTISEEQFKFARQRIHEAGLGDRVRVILSDYRDLEGQYDKLVSIEMIEAVGHHYFDVFFQKCCNLLKPEGHMLLQAIVIKDQRFEKHVRSTEFIREYIFPGGCLPSVANILQVTSRATDFRLLHLEDLAPHYAETLRHWRRSFLGRLDEVREQGYPERFIRMWEYYLSYCEAVFEERQVNNVQMVLARPQCRLDPVTDWRESPTELSTSCTGPVGASITSLVEEGVGQRAQRRPQRTSIYGETIR